MLTCYFSLFHCLSLITSLISSAFFQLYWNYSLPLGFIWCLWGQAVSSLTSEVSFHCALSLHSAPVGWCTDWMEWGRSDGWSLLWLTAVVCFQCLSSESGASYSWAGGSSATGIGLLRAGLFYSRTCVSQLFLCSAMKIVTSLSTVYFTKWLISPKLVSLNLFVDLLFSYWQIDVEELVLLVL